MFKQYIYSFLLCEKKCDCLDVNPIEEDRAPMVFSYKGFLPNI